MHAERADCAIGLHIAESEPFGQCAPPNRPIVCTGSAALGCGASSSDHLETAVAAGLPAIIQVGARGSVDADQSAMTEAKIASWKAAEADLLSQIGGTRHYFVNTPIGRRFVDVMTPDLRANEAKTGWVGMSSKIMRQIKKDSYLLGSGEAKEVTWNFYRSSITGRIGADPAVLAELRKRGFGVSFH
jgi:hypothetical protein